MHAQSECSGERRAGRAPCQLRSLLRLLRNELKIMSAAAGANTASDSPAILALWMFCAARAARQRPACRQQRRSRPPRRRAEQGLPARARGRTFSFTLLVCVLGFFPSKLCVSSASSSSGVQNRMP